MKYRILLGLLLSGLTLIATAANKWQLNPGYFTPAKMPMTVVFPRPDNEISSLIARQQYAYADGTFQYRIPISIQGGAYPFYVDSTSGLPSGMTISSDPNSSDYMTAVWTPASGATGTYNCSVVIKDQDGNSVAVAWKVTIDNSKFLFIDPTAGTNGTGTKASPLNTMSGLTVPEGSGNTSTYAGKIVVLRGGTTNFVGPESDGSYDFNTTNNSPNVFIGYTGEAATLDMSSGIFRNHGQNDVYFGQLTIQNPPVNKTVISGGETDTMFYFDYTLSNRVTFFENTFKNFSWSSTAAPGAAVGSNQAVAVFFNPSKLRNYVAMVRNTLSNVHLPLVDTYAIKYGVFDLNVFETGTCSSQASAAGGFWLKSDIQNISLRQNKSINNELSPGLISQMGQAQLFNNDNIEIAYNLMLPPSSNSNALWLYMEGSGSEAPRIWVYRNTLGGAFKHWDNPGTLTIENNVIISNGSYYGLKCGATTLSTCNNLTVNASDISLSGSTGNLYGSSSNGYIDTSGNLTGSVVKYFGRIGYIISNGAPPLAAPTWR